MTQSILIMNELVFHIMLNYLCYTIMVGGDYVVSTQEWQKKLIILKQNKESLQKKSNTFVLYRFISFAIILLGIFVYYQYIESAGYIICGIGLCLFLSFVYLHSKIKKAILYNQRNCQVVQRYIDRRNDDWMKFSEKGETFIDECDSTFLDLDIIGDHSLYQLLCVAKSALGKRRLYEYFAKATSMNELSNRKDAIEEFASKLEESIQFQIALEEKKSENDTRIESSESALKNFISLPKIKGLSLIRYLPIITLTFGILSICSITPNILFYGLLMIQFLISLIFSVKEEKRITCYQNIHSYYAKDVNLYKQIESMKFESVYAQTLVDNLTKNGKASILLGKLDTALSMFSLRNNIILYIVFNAVCMFDIQYLNVIEAWREKHAKNIKQWYSSLAEMEALLSCSLLIYARDNTCIPNIVADNVLMIEAKQCAHPLINEDEVIDNDFTIHGTSIITGSNMSGKSTFMRCVGLNVILANAGCRACAETFTLPYMQVVSSMRLKDELSAGISSFYAEVLRIKQIMEICKKQIPVLILIDEIFKGTNSIDRIAGAKEVIHKIDQPWIISLITTHDLELCDEMKNLDNYHFKEHYIDNQIHFDYLLQHGKCKTSNAIYLMKMAGIID